MSHPSPEPSPTPLGWLHCGDGTTPEDPVGCVGVRVPGHTSCLAHLADADRDAYLAGLVSGADIDHRGTSFSPSLLTALLDALRDSATGLPHLGDAKFGSAIFNGNAEFGAAIFKGVAGFESAIFMSNAGFELAVFEGEARFESAVFKGVAWFESATFKGVAWFESATFESIAGFRSVTVESIAGFRSAIFKGAAWFESVTVKDEAWFVSAVFKGAARFESAAFKGVAGFESVTFEISAWFESAIFDSIAWFMSASFKGDAWFGSAVFKGVAGFESAIFESDAEFVSASFKSAAWFGAATFKNVAGFVSAMFEGDAGFESATFKSDAWFGGATFKGIAGFEAATFKGEAGFGSVTFERALGLGPLVCVGQVTLSGAVFGGPVSLLVAARRLECGRTRWLSTAEVRLRYATVNFAHAVFEYPLTIAAEPDPFVLSDGQQVAEEPFTVVSDAAVRIASLRGVDAAHLVLADVDLTGCVFTGTVHLDQLRLEGTCSFATAPPGTHWRHGRPARFTRRRTLAEEHHWRASQPTAVPGWSTAASGAGHVGPTQLAPVYRALRKAFEDSKNEPGAADFYYGEMEMRRHDRTDTTRAERGLLHGYWLLSGYGLRASRALGWLVAAMLVTIVLLMGFGLPKDDPKQEATGTLPSGGGKVTFEIDKSDPQNPTGDRFTGERFEKALNVTLNSVVFRSSGQDLTTAGTYIEMASRLTEPVLLGLAVLAVRSRVKR